MIHCRLVVEAAFSSKAFSSVPTSHMAAVPANSSLSSSSLSSSSLSRRESLPGWAGSASWQQAQLFLPMVVLQAQSHRACTQMLQVHAVQVCTSKLRCDDVHGLLMILIMRVTNLPCAEKHSSPHCHVMLSACKNASAKEHQSKKLTATAMQIEPLSTDTLPCFASVQKRTVASHGQNAAGCCLRESLQSSHHALVQFLYCCTSEASACWEQCWKQTFSTLLYCCSDQ